MNSIYGSACKRQINDHTKLEHSLNSGITLIPIPFWWDKSHSILMTTIQQYRPDLDWIDESSNINTISFEMPTKYQQQQQYIPNIVHQYNENQFTTEQPI